MQVATAIWLKLMLELETRAEPATHQIVVDAESRPAAMLSYKYQIE